MSWLRGPRLPEEVAAQEALFPAATLYRAVPRPRGRELDLAIATGE